MKTEQERIKEFKTIMQPCIPYRIKSGYIDILQKQGFFIAPASINHHGAYPGALFDHSLAVTKNLLWLTEKLNLQWGLDTSPLIVGMFHDLCKVDNYVHDADEKWMYNNAPLLTGHGEKSVIMLQRYVKISPEELYCIRWHMGAFDKEENWNSYRQAVTHFPNVLYTHTADMIAARIQGV